MRKLTITYDRGDALFHVIEETEHGGVHEWSCAHETAVDWFDDFMGGTLESVTSIMLGRLTEGRLTRITLEAP